MSKDNFIDQEALNFLINKIPMIDFDQVDASYKLGFDEHSKYDGSTETLIPDSVGTGPSTASSSKSPVKSIPIGLPKRRSKDRAHKSPKKHPKLNTDNGPPAMEETVNDDNQMDMAEGVATDTTSMVIRCDDIQTSTAESWTVEVLNRFARELNKIGCISVGIPNINSLVPEPQKTDPPPAPGTSDPPNPVPIDPANPAVLPTMVILPAKTGTGEIKIPIVQAKMTDKLYISAYDAVVALTKKKPQYYSWWQEYNYQLARFSN